MTNTTSALSAAPFDVEVFFDGDCPLCAREIAMLRRLDRRARIRFTDIAARTFDPSPIGIPMSVLVAEIHGRLPDGTFVTGVEVFRRLYAAVGLGALVQMTRWPFVSAVLDAAYARFAKNRLRWTGRCTSDTCELPA